MNKTSEEIRKLFIDFYLERGHKEIPNVSLVPREDSTLLFVNAGMFPLAPYLAGEKHPMGTRLCNIQRCLRTKYDEMVEVGDNRHTLMFEMMGNWSLGDYFKEEQIPWYLELYVERYGLDPHRLFVSVWGGDDMIPQDKEAIEIWKQSFRKYGVEAEFSEDITNIPEKLEDDKTHKYRIFPYDRKKNWWQRGETEGELGGPSSEMFYDLGTVERKQEKYHINDDSGRFVEIGNNVFMEYRLNKDLDWEKLPQRNVDFGGGFERIVMCIQGKTDIFETDIYSPIIHDLEKLSGKEYKNNGKENEWTAPMRVIADHARAATFILADGIEPSNKDQGYILRRFIRRMVRYANKLELKEGCTSDIAKSVIDRLGNVYPHLIENEVKITEKIVEEESKFRKSLEIGLKEIAKKKMKNPALSGKEAFDIYQTYGFPIEMIVEEYGLSLEEAENIIEKFKDEETIHREKSRAGIDAKFKGGLADSSEKTTSYHTVTHLLNAALKKLVDPGIYQKGSNITAERLRFDFPSKEKLTQDQVTAVENWINDRIRESLPVSVEEMTLEDAKTTGAEGVFDDRYSSLVKVYTIGEKDHHVSREICGGPHVKNTSEIIGTFKIKKQENLGSGIKRIKAVIE